VLPRCSGRIDTAVIVAAGPGALPGVPLPADALMIAVDGGAERALELGIAVDLVVGDLDSIAQTTLESLERAGAEVERHPREKDASDLALAFDAAVERGARRILLVGAQAGRLDHLFGELMLLGAERYAGIEVDALLGTARIHVVRHRRSFAGDPGELVSLFALHGRAAGVTTEGLTYALQGESLEPGSSRGVSNTFSAPEARVSVEQGVVLAVCPGETA
jgi:thiamine pyrophosphokinase